LDALESEKGLDDIEVERGRLRAAHGRTVVESATRWLERLPRLLGEPATYPLSNLDRLLEVVDCSLDYATALVELAVARDEEADLFN
jgi:hypothetical protein